MALDTTVGGSTSDSYVSIADADTYFANHYSTTKSADWAALTSGQKESALRRGAQVIDSLRVLDTELGWGALPVALLEVDEYNLTIHRLQFNQRMQFPRNLDLEAGVGFIPQNVKDAQCEQAVFLITFDDSVLQSSLQGITSETIQAGPIRVHQSLRQTGSFVSPMAVELMRIYFRPTKRIKRA